MAKRYIDTGFLKQKWIKKLSPERKIFLIYLMLECDNAGIIELDLEDAEFWVGKKIGNPIEFLPENYLLKIPDTDKYIIPKFIEWQYGDLKSDKNIVRQARQLLNKYELIDESFTLNLHKLNINVTLIECNNTNSNSNSKDNSKDKEAKFKNEVLQFNYPKEMLNEFINYWTEPNKSKTKLRYELQTTWDTSRRLGTWAKNTKQFTKKEPERKIYKSSNFDEVVKDDNITPGEMPDYIKHLAGQKTVK